MVTTPSQLSNQVNFATANLSQLVVGCDNTASTQSQKFTIDALRTKILENITGSTNLAATHSPTGVVVTSDTGTDATINLATTTNAGAMWPAHVTTLGFITVGTAVNLNTISANSHVPAAPANASIQVVNQAINVRVSATAGNLIQLLSDGLYVTAVGNRLLGEDDLGSVGGSLAIDLDAGTSRNKKLNLTANITLTFTSALKGDFKLFIRTNGFTWTLANTVSYVNSSSAPTLNSAIFDGLSLYYRGA